MCVCGLVGLLVDLLVGCMSLTFLILSVGSRFAVASGIPEMTIRKPFRIRSWALLLLQVTRRRIMPSALVLLFLGTMYLQVSTRYSRSREARPCFVGGTGTREVGAPRPAMTPFPFSPFPFLFCGRGSATAKVPHGIPYARRVLPTSHAATFMLSTAMPWLCGIFGSPLFFTTSFLFFRWVSQGFGPVRLSVVTDGLHNA